MSTHEASVQWQRVRKRAHLLPRTATEEPPAWDHIWRMGAAPELRASAPPSEGGSEGLPNPEEALVCAVASSHMLRFLELCEERHLPVQGYEDNAEGRVERAQDGRLALTAIRLRPEVMFGKDASPSYEELVKLHELAEKTSPIGASLRCQVMVEPAFFPPPFGA